MHSLNFKVTRVIYQSFATPPPPGCPFPARYKSLHDGKLLMLFCRMEIFYYMNENMFGFIYNDVLYVDCCKVRNGAKIRSRYNQAPHLTHDTNGKVTTSQLDITNESQEVSPFLAGDHKASTNRCAGKHNKTRQK